MALAQTDFAAMLGLPHEEQRRLLREGDPPERLWATWALALELGAGVIPLVEKGALLQGHAGLRCQLLVVLAGLGERSLLHTVALHDPSSEVRATACAYFSRTAPSTTDPETLAFAQTQLSSGTVDVREALLQEHKSNRIELPLPVLLSLLADPDIGVRNLAFDCVCPPSGPPDTAIDALLERLCKEPDEDLVLRIFLAIPRPRQRTLFEVLSAAPTDRLVHVLALARQCHGTLDWPDLVALSDRREPAILTHVLPLLRSPPSDEAFRWVARSYVLLSSGEAEGSRRPSPSEAAQWLALPLLQTALSPETAKLLDLETAAVLGRAFKAIAEDSAEVLEDDEEVDPEYWATNLARVRDCIAWLSARQGTR